MEQTKEEMTVSVVIPIYNEEECVTHLKEQLMNALSGLKYKYEIILINDGSNDKTQEMLDAICEEVKEFRAIHFAENCGQSAAMTAGFMAARGTVTVTLDADLQNDPADIPMLLEKMNGVDCVCGWREKRDDTFIRRKSSQIANGIRNWLSGETIRDTGCSLKAYRTELLQKIYMFRGGHRFLPTLLKMEGATVIEVPVKHHPRTLGNSKYGILNRVFCSFHDLLGIRWMKSRLLNYKIDSSSGTGLSEK